MPATLLDLPVEILTLIGQNIHTPFQPSSDLDVTTCRGPFVARFNRDNIGDLMSLSMTCKILRAALCPSIFAGPMYVRDQESLQNILDWDCKEHLQMLIVNPGLWYEPRAFAISLKKALYSLTALRHLKIYLPRTAHFIRDIFREITPHEIVSHESGGLSKATSAGGFWQCLESLDVTSEEHAPDKPFDDFIPLLQRATRLKYLALHTDFSAYISSIESVLTSVPGSIETLVVSGHIPDRLTVLLRGCLQNKTRLKNLKWAYTVDDFDNNLYSILGRFPLRVLNILPEKYPEPEQVATEMATHCPALRLVTIASQCYTVWTSSENGKLQISPARRGDALAVYAGEWTPPPPGIPLL